MIEANPRSPRAWRIYWLVAAGLCALAALLLGLRGVSSFRARKALTALLAASTAEVERLGPPRAKLVLPAFDGGPVVHADCVAVQQAASGRAPDLPRRVAENGAWLPPNHEQLEFAAAHADEIAAFGAAAAKCDRVAPALAPGRAAWGEPLEMFRRFRALIIAGRARAAQGDVDRAVLLFLQSRRFGFELGLDGNVLESIIGATAIGDADDALARLVGSGLAPALRERIGREIAALEPVMPNLADAVRLDNAERASFVAASLLQVPAAVDVLLPSPSFDVSESGFDHWVLRWALPSSAVAVRHLVSAQAGNERALRDFDHVDASAPEFAVWGWGWLGATYSSVATGKARDTRFQLLARSALLQAALGLERARDGDRDAHYPTAPELPLDPFALGKPLGYGLLADGRYRLSTVGTKKEPKEAWIIVSGPGTRAPEPPSAGGAAR